MNRYEENEYGQLIDRKTGTEVSDDRKHEILGILNAHDDLVAALKKAEAELREQYWQNGSKSIANTLQLVGLALAKAEGLVPRES